MSHYALNLALALLPEIALLAGGCLIVMLLARPADKPGTHRTAAWAALVTVFVAAALLQFGPDITTDQLAGEPTHAAVMANASHPQPGPPILILNDTARAARWAAIFVGILLLGGSFYLPEPVSDPNRFHLTERGSPEFFMFLLFSLAGLMITASANDLIVLFLALELTSLPTVAMVALSRPRHGAIEAGGKYFFLSIISAAFLLLGLAYIYGLTGQTALTPPREFVAGDGTSPIAIVGLGLVLAGLAFNIAAFPYHVYIADVYQGASAPVAGWLSFVTKAAGFLVLVKVLAAVAGPIDSATGGWLGLPLWRNVIAALAVATMTAGNVLALWQKSVKRMLAYSSVAHSGYILVGLLVMPEAIRRAVAGQPAALPEGLAAALSAAPQWLPDVVLFYLVAYGLANLGAFLALAAARVPNRQTDATAGVFASPEAGEKASGSREADSYDDLRGLARRNLPLAVALAIFGFSLMGLPPLVGFLAKVYIFVGAFQTGFGWLVVIALINAAVGVAYYLRMVGACWLDVLEEPQAGEAAGTAVLRDAADPLASSESPGEPVGAPGLVIAVLAGLTVLFGLFPGGLYRSMTSPQRAWEILQGSEPATSPAAPEAPENLITPVPQEKAHKPPTTQRT